MSSEALERAKQTVREALEQGVLSHQCGVDSIAAFGALLAEVARLEQERDEAQKWANTMEHERDWETQVVHSELLGRAESAEAALAVAREREQRADDDLLARLVTSGALNNSENGRPARWRIDAAREALIARAALADEPAAAERA